MNHCEGLTVLLFGLLVLLSPYSFTGGASVIAKIALCTHIYILRYDTDTGAAENSSSYSPVTLAFLKRKLSSNVCAAQRAHIVNADRRLRDAMVTLT